MAAGAKATPWMGGWTGGGAGAAIAGSTGVTRGAGCAARGFDGCTTCAAVVGFKVVDASTGAAIGLATLASNRIDTRCGMAAFGVLAGCHAIATNAQCAATITPTIHP